MHILVVDDEAFNRELIKMFLTDSGHSCIFAENGQQACDIVLNTGESGVAEKASNSDIDLILMDINMPVMNGYRATRTIKSALQDDYIPIVFVTALDDDTTLSKCLRVGGDDFIPKPLNHNTLLAKLTAHARTASLHAQLVESNRQLQYHKDMMAREHSVVDHVFQNSMRRSAGVCDNVCYYISPMSMFNGDLLLVTASPTGGIYILLGDFTGHGLSAAIGCLPVAEIFYAMAKKHKSVDEIAAEINKRLRELLPLHMFLCAVIVELNQTGDRLCVWLGGMNDLLIVSPQGCIEQRIVSSHMPLGIALDNKFKRQVDIITPPANSYLYMYTDGIVETQNQAGEMFGEARLEALFGSADDDRVKSICAAVTAFQSGQEQMDDVSIVELACSKVLHTHDGEQGISLLGNLGGLLPDHSYHRL